MKPVTKVTLALGLVAGAALAVPGDAFARGGGGGGGKSAGSSGGKGGAPKSGGSTGKGGTPGAKGGAAKGGSKSSTGNAKGRGDFLQDMQRDDAADDRANFLGDATLEVIRTRRSSERGE